MMGACDDGFVGGEGSNVGGGDECENRKSFDKVAYTLFYTTCPGFDCPSRVGTVTDTTVVLSIK